MREFLKTLIASRAFWSSLGPAILAIFTLAGHPLMAEQAQALGILLSAFAGWFGVTVARVVGGKPASYRMADACREDEISRRFGA